MQSRRPSPPPSPGILEKSWFTYLLTGILILLIVALVLAVRYQDEVARFFRKLWGHSRKPVPPRVADVGPQMFLIFGRTLT